MSFEEYLDKMKQMIDELKAMSMELGMSNTGDEYKVISELFTYKFLNDKLLYDFDNREDKEEDFDEFVEFEDETNLKMKWEHTVHELWKQQNEDDFHKIFDDALKAVDALNKEEYNITTSTGKKKALFEPLALYIKDEDKELELAKRAINIMDRHTFTDIYDGGFDYFSSIFEYLIKDYNKDSGKYAEYFTPLFAGNIIADILYDDTPVSKVTVYDPSAGSGTLLLALANRIGINNCKVYSQDISQKSTQFLRINLILNKLTHSLHNVIEGNTLTTPRHLEGEDLRKFDFIVSNPPFKMDFSNMISNLEADKFKRFFAGLPNIPKKKKEGMAVYETFLQHVIESLSNSGRAGVVVPTGFTTSGTSIAMKIRKKLIDNNWLRGVVHMPSNIFATTGTSVSIIFIDKTRTEDDDILLMDASNLGAKMKLDDGQRTILSEDEKGKITGYFKSKIEEPEFSVRVPVKDIVENNYCIQAGQYVKLKDDILDYDVEERLNQIKSLLMKELQINIDLSNDIIRVLEDV